MVRTPSKKTKTVNKNPQTSEERRDKFDVIPQDLVIEIFGRLPLKSVARFLLVSKKWAIIIRSRDFVRSFPLGSCSSQPRLLITLSDLDGRRGLKNWYYFSSSSSFLSRISCPFPNTMPTEYYSHYVNGLISLGYGHEQFIVNPSTGKSIALPRLRNETRRSESFFGYDSVTDEYKVLCITEKVHAYPRKPSYQHQVFTLGAKKWKMIECRIPHHPWSNGVCIKGVVYYVASREPRPRSSSHMFLMRFGLRSDKLDLITGVPSKIVGKYVYDDTFISNYEGKVAIPYRTSTTFDVWVMDQDTEIHEWIKKLSFSIEPWKNLFDSMNIRGITQTGEFILVPLSFSGEVYVFQYNHKTESLRRIEVEVNTHYEFQRLPRIISIGGLRREFVGTRAVVFPDYVESVRLL